MPPRADLGRRFAAKLGVRPRGHRPLTRAEVERKLGRRVSDADVRAVNRSNLLQARKGDNPEAAEALATTNAATVREQGGDPSRFERRARELRRHNFRRRLVSTITARAPRRPRARGCGRPGGRRRLGRTSGSRGDPPTEGEDDPEGPLARLRRRVARSPERAS